MSGYCWSSDGECFFGVLGTIEEAACAALDDADGDEFSAGVEIERWIGEPGPPLEEPDPDEGMEYEVRNVRRLVVTSFADDAAGVRIGYRFDDGATGVAEWRSQLFKGGAS